jgi:hypothetical protein
MSIRIISKQDFFAGALFAAIALFFLWNGLDLPIGSSVRMGPGYAPRLLGGALFVVGGGLMIRGIRAEVPDVVTLDFRPMFFVLGSVLIFAFGLERIGLVLTTFLVVSISSLSAKGGRLWEVVIIAALAAAATAALFVFALKLNIPLWPRF